MNLRIWAAAGAAIMAAGASLQAAPNTAAINVQITQVPLRAPAGPYEQVLHVLALARRTGNIRTYSIGRTAEGRNIPLVVLTPVGTRVLPRTRVLVICAQHGDEPASAYAMAGLIRKCALRRNPEQLLAALGFRGESLQLGRVLWLIVPMANPDGLERGTRVNGAGVDLNRDWISRTQPETRAIKRVFDRWAPQVVLDLHNWTRADPPPAGTGMEMTTRSDGPVQTRIERGLAHSALAAVKRWGGQSVAFVTSSAHANPSLAHRYFASRGAVSFLIETAAGARYAERKRVLTGLVLMISSRVDHMRWPDADGALAAARKFHYPERFRTWLDQTNGLGSASASNNLRVTGTWIALALWLLLVGIRQRSMSGRQRQSHRRRPSLLRESLALSGPCRRSRLMSHQAPGPIGQAYYRARMRRNRHPLLVNRSG